MKHLTHHCEENSINRLDDMNDLEKNESEVNNHVNPYANVMTPTSTDLYKLCV